mmetsp:Transcript_1393/g.3610  ORF Transcript_1393/g.3610 Transcript_1393/m.3610 type:complete len:173 (+) Transcript_1393:254-772(+)
MAAEAMITAECGAAVERYQTFIEGTLQPDLRRTLDAIDAADARAAEYASLRSQLERLNEDDRARGDATEKRKDLKFMVNLGRDFYAQARTSADALVLVDIGLGFHAELTRTEAISCAERHEAALAARSKELTARAAAIRAHISVALEAIEELARQSDAPDAGGAERQQTPQP